MSPAPRRFRLVVFDLDGTLVDSSRDLADAVNATLARLAPGAGPLPQETVRRFIGNGAARLVERSLAEVGLPRPVPEVLPLFLEESRARLLATTRLYDGVAGVLRALSGCTLAVLTNKPGDMSRALLDGLGVGALFARVYGGGDLPGRKPDPVGLQRLMEEFGASPAETVLVGDSAIDVRTARAAGVAVVGLRQGFDPEGLGLTRPDAWLDDIRSLPALLGGDFPPVLP